MNIAPVSKNQVFMRDIISKYHPKFSTRARRQWGTEMADDLNVERLFEQCLAEVGGYDRVDEAGRDFNDPWNSDSKTCSVRSKPDSKWLLYEGRIKSVESKIGSLRVAIFNPYKNRIDFAYVPKKDVDLLSRQGCGKGMFKKHIKFTWNFKKDHYNSFEQFRVRDFEALATAGG